MTSRFAAQRLSPDQIASPAPLVALRDLATVRKTLRRIQQSDRLAELKLFGRRTPRSRRNRRSHERTAIELPILVTCADFDGTYVRPHDAEGDCILALTRDVSLRGVGFAHEDPLECDYAVITFDLMFDQKASLLLEVRWANRKTRGTYLSGGRFCAVIEDNEDEKSGEQVVVESY